MVEFEELFRLKPYELDSANKRQLMVEGLNELNKYHNQHSDEYERFSQLVFKNRGNLDKIENFPFLPVSAFKNHLIKSVEDDQVFKVLTSSGTTGQAVSRIVLDKSTSQLQTKALNSIVTGVIGSQRLPMLIVDSKAVFANRNSFSARGAGIMGLSIFGKDHTYILDENFELDESKLMEFLEKYNGQKILIFGFTFMVWEFLFKQVEAGKMDLSQAILIHSGGWKKLESMAVNNDTFKREFKEKHQLEQIYNFYGMVEQVGSVFMENSQGYLQCPNFSDVIIRNPIDFSVQPHGEPGLIQVLSLLPWSYPGHSLLTEDMGVVMGEDDAENGWNGKYFKILGRAKKAELRGCSDTFKK